MSARSSLVQEIRRSFDLATLRREAAHRLQADDWKTYREIKSIHDGKRRYLGRTYEVEHDYRMACARKELIDRAGAKNRSLTMRWFGGDRFNRESIDRQARIMVRHAHQNDLAKIDVSEAQGIKRLLERAEEQGRLREMPKAHFARATERRVLNERRNRQRA